MPYLKIQTNHELNAEGRAALMAKASRTLAESLGKPEQYVMIAVQDGTAMQFAGSDDPAAYMELKSIGLPESQTTALSQTLCDLVQTEIGVSRDRVYIEFTNAPRNMWGWNGATF